MPSQSEEFEHAVTRGSRVTLNYLAKQAMLEGVQFEREAERCRMEAELAFKDAGVMKDEGRRRAAEGRPRMLPRHDRATDVKTNTTKAMADAKGDHVYYTAQATMYAQMASAKFAKAAGLRAMVKA